MLIDFSTVLLALSGESLEVVKKVMGEDTKIPLTLSEAASEALLTQTEKDRNVTAIVKFDRFKLAEKIYDKGEVELALDETKIIKDRIGDVSSPIVIGPAWKILDPKLDPGKKEE